MSRLLASIPAADGFRMPAEFEPHAECWMAWPERADTWRDGGKPAQAAFAVVASAIAAGEPVTVTCSPDRRADARRTLPPDVRVLPILSDDAWMRDIGPTFVVDDHGTRRGIDWVFNAWGGALGGLHGSWLQDDAMASRVCEVLGDDFYRAPLVLEGGSIHVDGQGTLLTTEECLLNPNRNPSLERADLERYLHDYLGVEKVVWLGRGVVEDETDGHVDNLCCFVRPGVVLLTWTDDRSDPQYEVSLDARRRLEAATDARGRSLEVHLLQQPGPLFATEQEVAGLVPTPGTKPRYAGDRLAGSYVNSYLANARVIVPLLDPRHDDAALASYRDAFPEREVIGVASREMLLAGGNVHCITQQVPGPGVT